MKKIRYLLLGLVLPGIFLTLLFSNLQPVQAEPGNIYRVVKTGDGITGEDCPDLLLFEVDFHLVGKLVSWHPLTGF